MSEPLGFLMVAMEPPPALEEEFKDWYDTEHVPERQAVDGFQTATRFVCLNGWPRYLAFYDLRNHAVIGEPGYRAISGARFSPWSKRILARAQGVWRAHGEQIHASDARLGTMARLMLIRLRDVDATQEAALIERFRQLVATWPGAPRLKVLRNQTDAPGEYVAIVALSDVIDRARLGLERLGPFARNVDMVNEYAPYASGSIPGLSGS